MLLLAGFFITLSFLVVSNKRKAKHELAMETNNLLAEYNKLNKQKNDLTSKISSINEINNVNVTENIKQDLKNKTTSIRDEIERLQKEYDKLKPLYDKKKNEEEEEERKRRRRQQSSSGGYYGGYSSGSSYSSSSSSSSSWGGGGGGFSGGGASGSW